jgi:hypothetical protein
MNGFRLEHKPMGTFRANTALKFLELEVGLSDLLLTERTRAGSYMNKVMIAL